jgi:hypothetical protein
LYLATIFTGNFSKFNQHSLALSAVFLGFCLGHWQFFIFHHSPIEFLKYQRYLISWWSGSPQVKPGGVYDLIFANHWHTWWGSRAIVPVSTWWWGWALGLVFGLVSLILLVRQHKLTTIWQALSLWISFSFVIFTFSATYPRHLLLILPACYLLALKFFTTKKAAV